MAQPVGGRIKGRTRRLLALVAVASLAALLAVLLSTVAPTGAAIDSIDTAIYDAFYRRRPPDPITNRQVVILAVDQSSIDRMAAIPDGFRWPWPREYWGAVLEYLQQCGAKAVVFDLLFEEPSNYDRETGDDKLFAEKLDAARIPVILAYQAKGVQRPRFAPPVSKAHRFGAADVIDSAVVRSYLPFVEAKPSLAVETARAIDAKIPPWAENPFLLHFYGKARYPDGSTTFRYIPAFDLIQTMVANNGQAAGPWQQVFADKIVIIGTTAAATFDLKSAPMDAIYPSVEAQATAIENLLGNQRVQALGLGWRVSISLLAALLATVGAVIPRRVAIKVVLSLLAVAAVFGLAYLLFLGSTIHWLAPTMPLLAGVLGTIGGLSWTYFIEDRQRRAILKILSQYVSPHVARELSRKGELSLGGERREMTVLFTDIANFTSKVEHMNVEQLEAFMNTYLGEISGVLHDLDATLDKYIGDAVMCFWNAPLDQTEHADLACRAAILVCRHERAMQGRLAQFGIHDLRTRIGINTGPMVVGNMGSAKKVNYTVIGDAVNLASRLEGSNKIYGSQILVSESTAKLVPDRFLFRKLDRLRVKGRSQPLTVYELIDELDTADPSTRKLVERFEKALSAYEKQEWDQAEQDLVELQREFPDDAPTAVLLGRVRAMRLDPPGADWDGVHEAKEK